MEDTTSPAAARSTRARLVLAAVVSSLLLLQAPSTVAAKPSYVVYLGGRRSHGGGVSPEEAHRTAAESHYDLLGSVLGDREKAREAIFYSYTRNINGFAAGLEPEEAAAVAGLPGVVSVFPNRGRRLHTTRSWQFMGLERGDGEVPRWSAWKVARYGEGAIIGNLDSGVWPESLSFNDRELGPIPNSWKGICQNDHDKTFKCNSKLIGARYFNKGHAAGTGVPLSDAEMTPRDDNGHGTHTLATAGGSPVRNAAAFGYGYGTAKGGAPRARVAAYRVCYPPVNGSNECYDADILAAFEAAIADGVHVISASVGADPNYYFQDAVAIGALHAVKAGVTVVCSASNFGPDPGTVTNVAPWILTVAASTVDRAFPAHVVFNRTRADGQSLSGMWLRGKGFPLMVSAAAAVAPGRSPADAKECNLGALDAGKVTGKIVVCLRGGNPRVEKGEAVSRAGGVGMILVNDEASGDDVIADAHILPAVHIGYNDGLALLAYINSTKVARGFITKAKTLLGTTPAPVMASFSSQGPNTVNPEILKPDVTAPGVSVIAAWTGAAGPTGLPYDQRRVAFNTQTGTSMSCPHVSGVAGLVKTLHPEWSPGAIKSAIMTSATELDSELKPILNSSRLPATPFSYGAGHVFPHRALDPGLVYDATATDYLDFLCGIGYNASSLELFNEAPYRCPDDPLDPVDLNYPSITVYDLAEPTAVRRRVRNVGPAPVTYTATVVKEPEGVQVTVTPPTLTFASTGEVRQFWVKLAVRDPAPAADYAFGAIVWSDGSHLVRSPLVVKTQVAG
ncbi:subtilisin-like protease SBT5.3 [Oryza brachyantha]|uniref:Subtilisin-like protease n=1 Tax=Oryza brachyantha TaxID=4533 RepID=C0JAD4_ORYBR|nr:subtilisin-like protease SBT5.3 [Oryza brachyantha]ACN85315.1 subtilisin-like protease precursor [Oryza brachyantha]